MEVTCVDGKGRVCSPRSKALFGVGCLFVLTCRMTISLRWEELRSVEEDGRVKRGARGEREGGGSGSKTLPSTV